MRRLPSGELPLIAIPHAPPGTKARRPELDGIRALAIGAVLAFHCLIFTAHGHSVAGYAARIVWAGWGGVDAFFVLSGFLVGGVLIDGRGQPKQLRRFLIRRFMRIAPLYAVVLASFYAIPATFAYPLTEWPFAGASPWWSYATLTQNFATPIQGHDAVYLGPTWSLAVEVQIYLLLGVLLTRVPSHATQRMMVAGVLIAEACRIIATASGHGMYGYFVLPARIDGACLGVITALLVRDDAVIAFVRRRSAMIWAAVLVAIASAAGLSMAGQGFGSPGANLYTHLALAIASAATIITLVVNPAGAVNRFLQTRPLVGLGAISYGVYLVHIPVIGMMRVLFGRPGLVLEDGKAATATALGVVLTIMLAQLSFSFFETPLNRWAHRVSRPPNRQRVSLAAR
jgi:peptidoglycan/LPS O-acetylase OafA/YrhL